MTRLMFSISAMLLCFTLCAQAQFKQPEFIIGTFADPNLSRPENWEKDVASFQRAKDAWFNLMTGPQFYTGAGDFSMMNRVLKIVNHVGLKLLVIDSRLSISEDTFTNKKADFLISHFKSVDSKALLGYNFGGEFQKEHSPRITKWIGYFKARHPGKLVYTYLLPNYGFSSRKEYEKYVDGYLKPGSTQNIPDVIAYDHYPFIGQKELRDDYFYNLKYISGKTGSRPFWIYVNTAKFNVYPDPGEYHLFYTCFSPIAYGAKGILYFTYETVPYKEYGDGLLSKEGVPNAKFYIAKKINHYIHDILGPVVMESTRLGTWHSGTASAYENLADQVLPKNNRYIQSINTKDVLTGVFRHKKTGTYYLFVVNNAPIPLTRLQITVNSTLGKRYTISPPVNDYDGKTKALPLTPEQIKQQYAILSLSLKPGEGRIITILK